MGVKRSLDEANASGSANKITEAEAALYDRQIRLWGMDCQKRLREAQVLVIGLNGVGAEVVKNLTLSGVKSITILDDTEVKPSDKTAQFFVAESEPGKKRSEASLSGIQELNPNVKVLIETGDPSSKEDTFFANYNAVFATGCPMDVLIKIDKMCREHSVQFYCADTWGFYGYGFLDLQKHKCSNCGKVFKKKDNTSITEEVRMEEELEYCALGPTLLTKVGEGLRKRVNKVFILLHIVNHFRELVNRYPAPNTQNEDFEQLKKIKGIVCDTLGYDVSKIDDSMLSCVFGELSPVCATVGGIVTNEIIKGISKIGIPVYNYFLFDGIESVGVNEKIMPKKN